MLDDAELVEDFITEASERLDRVADSALAAEEGDPGAWADLRREIHTLKGAAGFVGYDEFSELCHDLEEYLLAADASNDFDIVHDSCDILRKLTDGLERCLRTQSEVKAYPEVKRLRTRLRAAS